MMDDIIEYEWRYCSECDEEYMLLEDDCKCIICGNETELIQ